MNNFNLRKLFLPLVALLLLLSSCNLDNSKDEKGFLIAGTWLKGSSEIILTETQYTNNWYNNGAVGYTYSGEILFYENHKFNTETTKSDLGTHGYLVLKYTGGAGDGKIGVLRWYRLNTTDGVTAISYSEGYNNGTYYDSVEDAIAGMDDSFFGGETTDLIKQ